MGYLLASPLRKLLEPPGRILEGYVRSGMTVMDVGSGMGFFTLEMARLVGEDGHVIAIDLQPRMIASLERRAARAGLARRITTRVCGSESLDIEDLTGQVDFVLVYAVAHEVPDAANLMAELYGCMKPGGRMLLAEPSGHVTEDAYRATEATAVTAGFVALDHPVIRRSHATLFEKQQSEATV